MRNLVGQPVLSGVIALMSEANPALSCAT